MMHVESPSQSKNHAASRPSRRTSGEGWVYETRGLRVLRVKGSFYEMGRQHGALLSSEIRRGPIPYYRHFVQKLFGGGAIGRLGPALFTTLQHTVGRKVAKTMPSFAVETLRGVADGAGIPFQDLLDGGTMPDSMVWLASKMIALRAPGPAVAHRLSLGIGCTSAVAWGEATTDGRLLHARNFDYHGVSTWPSTATIIFHEPDDGLRYVSVSAAGVPMGGVTAMNEAGLTLTVHQHMFTAESKLGGTPIAVVGDEVMRKARTLADAERILESYTHIGCWTYLVTSAKEKAVLCWEESPARKAPRRSGARDTTFGYANIYLDRELGDTEANLYGAYWRHNHARYVRVNERLLDEKGGLDPKAMANILGDTGAGACRVAESIAMVLTVGSVVFRPEDGAFWVGTGEAPTSRQTFAPFHLGRQDYAPDLGDLPVAKPETASADAAFAAFRDAYVAYMDASDVGAARAALDRAASLAPEQPVYHATAGLLALQGGDAKSALRSLTRAIELGHAHEERVASFHLWRARAHDLLGDRAAADRDYRAALARRADDPVRAAAHKGLKRPYTARRAARIHVDMSLGDVVAP